MSGVVSGPDPEVWGKEQTLFAAPLGPPLPQEMARIAARPVITPDYNEISFKVTLRADTPVILTALYAKTLEDLRGKVDEILDNYDYGLTWSSGSDEVSLDVELLEARPES